MIYTANSVQGTAPQHISFAQRNISGFTQSILSAVPIHGKRTLSQLAYDGYKANIDAFLHSTAIGERISCSIISAPFPSTYVPSVPLPLPKVMFRLAQKKPSPEYLSKISSGLEKFGFDKHESGKGQQMYSVAAPNFKLLRSDLPAVCEASCPTVDGYCTVEAARAACLIYQAIDLFLRTNSYPYTRTLDGSDKLEPGRHGSQWELKIKGAAITGDRPKKLPRIDEAGTRGVDEDGDPMEVEDIDEAIELTHCSEPFSEVLTAKPSPLPSSNNFGTPSSVPFLPGLVFPYFPGLIAGDPKFIRTSVIDMLFRNCASEEFGPRAGYVNFRKAIGTFVYTPEGLICAHVLKGMELALDCQAQLYLLIDKGQYLGFCLLGGLYAVFHNGSWHEPMDATALQNELYELVTHDGQLESLATAMSGYADYSTGTAGPKIKVTKEDIASPLALCKVLAMLNLDVMSDDDVEKVRRGVEGLSFQSKYKGVGVESVIWALEMMTTKVDEPLPSDLPIYIPTSNYHLLRRREFLILSCFGPRTFSFISSGGVEYKIPTTSSKDVLSELDDSKRDKVLPMVVVSIKPPQQALQDWDSMMNKGVIKFDKNERAKGSRCFVYHNRQRDLLWQALRSLVADTRAKNGPPAAKKRKVDEAAKFGARADSIDEITFG